MKMNVKQSLRSGSLLADKPGGATIAPAFFVFWRRGTFS